MNEHIANLGKAFESVLVFCADKLVPKLGEDLNVIAEFIERMKKPEELALFAREILREEYERDVKLVAEAVEKYLKSGTSGSQTGVEYLEETIDGCERVSCLLKSQEGIASSQNEDAIEDEGMADAPNYMQIMYYALRADVLTELRERGIDVNQTPEDMKSEGGDS